MSQFMPIYSGQGNRDGRITKAQEQELIEKGRLGMAERTEPTPGPWTIHENVP